MACAPSGSMSYPISQFLKFYSAGDADVAVADDFYLKDDPKIGLKRIPILSEQLLLSVPKSHYLACRRSVKINDLEDGSIMRSTTLNETKNWLDKILDLNKTQINWSMALDSETWQYYLLNNSGEMPPYFESSSSFLTSREAQSMREKRSLIKVDGIYTNRMVFLWYFREQQGLSVRIFAVCKKRLYIN